MVARGRDIWIIYSLVPLREGIYHGYTPLGLMQKYTRVGYIDNNRLIGMENGMCCMCICYIHME